MSAPVATQVCSRCDAPVFTEDLTQGLAIHLDGVPICPNCIELLPVHVRLEINQVRASKGLAVTVYKMPHPRHPKMTLYTFSSAGMFTIHRQALRLTGTYHVRPLSHKSWYGGVDRLVAGRSRLLFIGGVLLAAGVVGMLVWTILGDHRENSAEVPIPEVTTSESAPAASAPTLVTEISETRLKRQDLPRDAYQAWERIQTHLQATPELRAEIAGEVANRREAELAEIAGILDRQGPDVAEQRLALQRVFGDSPAFARVVVLEKALVLKISERRQIAAQVPVAPPLPVAKPIPEPAPDPVSAPPTISPSATEPDSAPDPAPVANTEAQEKNIVPLDWSVVATTGGKRAVLASRLNPGDPVIPSPWPQLANSEELPEFIHSDEERTNTLPGWKNRQVIHLELPARLVAGGGVSLVVHAGSRLAKRELIAYVDPGRRGPIPLIFEGSWSTVVIPVEGSENLDANEPVSIHVADADPAKTLGKGPFWFGPGIATARQSPLAADLSVMPPVFPWDLVVRNARPRDQLIRLITQAVQCRGGGSWQSPAGFNPQAIKVLCAEKTPEWTTAMRQVLPRPDDVTTLANSTVDDFLLDPKWWIDSQLNTAKPTVDSKKFHVICVIPNGAEAKLTPERWAAQLKELMAYILVGVGKATTKAGFLPVVVLGSVDNPGFTPDNWTKAREELERQGIPLIDLTVLPREGLTKKAWIHRSSQAISHGLANLAYQLRWRQNKR